MEGRSGATAAADDPTGDSDTSMDLSALLGVANTIDFCLRGFFLVFPGVYMEYVKVKSRE